MSVALASETVEHATEHDAVGVAERDSAQALEDRVVELVRLAGGRIQMSAFHPAAFLLVRSGIIDGAGLTFGSDYDLNIRSRELTRGFVDALNGGRLSGNGTEMWLIQPDECDDDADARAEAVRKILSLPRTELLKRARRLLLAE